MGDAGLFSSTRDSPFMELGIDRAILWQVLYKLSICSNFTAEKYSVFYNPLTHMNFNQPHPLWPQVQDPPLPPHINAQNAALYLPHCFGAINGTDPPALHFSRFAYSAALNLVFNAPIHLFQAVHPGNLPQNLQQNVLQITQRFPLPLTLSLAAVHWD